MLRELDYQKRVLETLDAYLDILGEEKAKADKVAALVAAQPDLGIDPPDYGKKAWDRMQADGKLPTSRAAFPFRRGLTGSVGPCLTWSSRSPQAAARRF